VDQRFILGDELSTATVIN